MSDQQIKWSSLSIMTRGTHIDELEETTPAIFSL
jgi:hypothetical protein